MADAEAEAEVPSSCEEPTPASCCFSRTSGLRGPSREVADSGTSGTSAQHRHTRERRQIKFMAMVQEALRIELRIEHIIAVLYHCTCTRRYLTTGIHTVNCSAMALSARANSSEDESA